MAARKQGRSKAFDSYYRNGQKATSVAEWDCIPSTLLSELVIAVSRARGAVLFGHSRDGGALQLTFFLDDQRSSDYHPVNDDVVQWFESHVGVWESIVDELALKSPKTG